MSRQHGVLYAWYQQQQQRFEQLQSEQGSWQRQQQAHAERLELLQQASTHYAPGSCNGLSALLVKALPPSLTHLSLTTNFLQQ